MIRIGSHHFSQRDGAPRASRLTLVVLAALLPVTAVLVAAAPVDAKGGPGGGGGGSGGGGGTPHKSYVCKYVGTPGVDERLQTGQNPIWVANASLTGGKDEPVQVGDTFSDAQGKSVVIVANTPKLDPEPDVSQCPAPVGPEKVTPTAPTATAPTCDADGSLVVPADTATVTYASVPSGTGPGTYTVTATAAKGYVLDGTSTWTLTVLPKLTGDQCRTVATPVNPTVAPSTTCGVEGTYTIPTTPGIAYLLDGKAVTAGSHTGPASGTVTATALDGYRLADTTWSFALSLPAAVACPTVVVVTPVNPTVVQSTVCEVEGSYTIPTTTGITYLLDGTAVTAGMHMGPAKGTVTAQAKSGYTLSTTTWSFALNLAAAGACAVEAPTTTTPTTTTPTTTTTTESSTSALPKTGSSTATLAGAAALALLLGTALVLAARRPAGLR